MKHFELRDVQRANIRAVCVEIDKSLAHIPVEDELHAQWATLVGLLALEPARALRICPACKQVGMLEASRCGHCWAALRPVIAGDVFG